MTSIYAIINNVNGSQYVGSSKDATRRFGEHRKHLRRGIHACRHLQSAWNKYGEPEFEFFVVTPCDADRLLAEEQKAIDSVIRDCGREALYNASAVADRCEWSAESREIGRQKKVGVLNPFYGRVHSPEARASMSASRRGRVPWNKGKKATQEHRDAISRGGMGRKASDETKAKKSAIAKRLVEDGKLFTEAHLANLRAAQKRRREREKSDITS